MVATVSTALAIYNEILLRKPNAVFVRKVKARLCQTGDSRGARAVYYRSAGIRKGWRSIVVSMPWRRICALLTKSICAFVPVV